MALNLASFGRWTLRGFIAQRRQALRWTSAFARDVCPLWVVSSRSSRRFLLHSFTDTQLQNRLRSPQTLSMRRHWRPVLGVLILAAPMGERGRGE